MKKLLLLIEDNESDAKLTLRALKKCGIEHDVVHISDGAEALEWIRDASVLPTLTLLDLNLPRVDGIDILKELRKNERTRLLPVVVMTSSNEHEDIVRSLSAGANAFVRKPVDDTAFLEASKALGVFWLTMNEVPRPDSTK